MTATSLNKLRLVDTLDFRDPAIKRQCYRLLVPIIILSSPLFIVAIITLYTNGYSSYLELFLSLLIAIVLMAPIYVLHELVHFVFQWVFSHEMPRLSLKPPLPYSALALGVDISRKEGAICALSPFLCITSILVLLSMVPSPQAKAILLMAANIHIATCVADFLFIFWLFRHPKHLRCGTVGLVNALLEPIDDKE